MERKVNANDFFKASYRGVDLAADEAIVAISFKKSVPNEHVFAFKQSQRREDDIATVTACMAVRMSDAGKVLDCRIALGGVAPYTLRASEAEAQATGRKWSKRTIEAVRDALRAEINLPAAVPGGRAEYRSVLCASMWYKFALKVTAARQGEEAVPKRERSALRPLPYAYPRGEQTWGAKEKPISPVGYPVSHASGERQVTGEASNEKA